MIKRVRWTWVALFCLVFMGCYPYQGRYIFSLTEVELPIDSSERYSDVSIVKLEGDKYQFEDSLVLFKWHVLRDRFAFSLTNKTDNSMKIVWDEASYIDANGSSHRVMHSGVKYNDRNLSQPPTIVARRASIEDQVVPTNNVEWFAMGQYSKWIVLPLIQTHAASSAAELESLMSPNLGKVLHVLLPIEIKGEVNEYLFRFEVTNFRNAEGNGWSGYD